MTVSEGVIVGVAVSVNCGVAVADAVNVSVALGVGVNVFVAASGFDVGVCVAALDASESCSVSAMEGAN